MADDESTDDESQQLQARLEKLSYQQLIALAVDQARAIEGLRVAEQHLFRASALAASNALADSCFRHLDDIGSLSFVMSFGEHGLLEEDDAFRYALVCHSFYAAVCTEHPPIDRPSHAYHRKRFLTRRRSVVRSVSLLRWAIEQCKLALTPRICKSAAQANQLESLKWARDAGCEWNKSTCEAASEGGTSICCYGPTLTPRP